MLLWMGVIFLLSSQTATNLPDYGAWDVLFKKVAHFGAYALLAILTFWGTMAWKRPYLWAFLIPAVYALTDEFHQQFVAGRTSSLMDVMIDWAGALSALYLLRMVRLKQSTMNNEQSTLNEIH